VVASPILDSHILARSPLFNAASNSSVAEPIAVSMENVEMVIFDLPSSPEGPNLTSFPPKANETPVGRLSHFGG
jgi:hypothetical protein